MEELTHSGVAYQLEKAGHQVYLVGGAVRDSLLGMRADLTKDFDLATSATPEEICAIFPGSKSISARFHGVCHIPTVVDGLVEVATLRTESGYSDGRRPDSVSFTDDLKADLGRRDFTVNAIARDRNGNLYDYYGGIEDIKLRIIRCVGDPVQRFKEHPARLLRAVRFASMRRFTMHKDTLAAIRSLAWLSTHIPADTVREEILKGLDLDDPARYINLLISCGLSKKLFPELGPMRAQKQNIHHGDKTVLQHALEKATWECHPLLRFALLVHDVGKPDTAQFVSDEYGYSFIDHEKVGSEMVDIICRRLNFSVEDRALLVDAVRYHMRPIDTPKQARRMVFLCKSDYKKARFIAQLIQADRGILYERCITLIDDVERNVQATTIPQLAINGHDVMTNLHLEPSPQVGKVLNAALDYIVEYPDKNTYDDLIKFITKELT